MNKRNFGRVIKRIEQERKLWKQSRIPRVGEIPSCGTPCCFLGHAEYLRTRKPFTCQMGGDLADTYDNESLLEWLGLTMSEAIEAYQTTRKLSDFKRWHKAGRVPT